MADPAITIEAIRAARAALGSHIVTTPTLDWQADELRERLGADTRVNLKLELFQRTGTFKPRGALTVMMALDEAQRARGVTAVSAGNHAIATAYAARALGISARVVMLPTANPARIERCRRLGAEVEIATGGAAAFERAKQIEAEEGRVFVHPFEGPLTALGTATNARLSAAPFYGDVAKAEYPNYLAVININQSPARFITVIDPTGGFLAENYAAGRGQR